jgi:hypothetical protein
VEVRSSSPKAGHRDTRTSCPLPPPLFKVVPVLCLARREQNGVRFLHVSSVADPDRNFSSPLRIPDPIASKQKKI